MFRSAYSLIGYRLDAIDGDFGKVQDFLFDDESHIVRYLVAETGNWLPARRVLLSPVSLGDADAKSKRLEVKLSRQAIENSPGVATDLPVSRQHELELAQHFGWPQYWTADPSLDADLATRDDLHAGLHHALRTATIGENAHLRSIREVSHYYIEAIDGGIGHIEDFIIDTKSWTVCYVVIDTKNWWPGKKVLVGIQWMDSIDWKTSQMTFNAYREQIKRSPEYDPSIPFNCEYEQQLYDFYGRPKYS